MIEPWVYFQRFGIAFAFIPKVANTATKIAFAKALGMPIPENPEFIHRDIVGGPVSKVKDIDCQKFMFVRNPFDRLVSCWQSKLIDKQNHYKFYRYGMYDGIPFKEFAKIVCKIPDSDSDHHFRSQTYGLDDDNPMDISLGRFECLQYDWLCLRSIVPELPELEIVGASHKKNYTLYYDDELIGLVSKRYAKDLKELGYKFG